MSAPEHSINEGDIGTPISDTITFAAPVNLTAASVQLVYRLPEADVNIVRDASFDESTASPNLAACTSIDVQRNLDSVDVETPGIYIYQWKVTLADETTLIRPLSAPTEEFPDRKKPCFEIVESLSPTTETSQEDEALMQSNRPLTVDDIAALIALPRPRNSEYGLVFVLADENDSLASFEFDAAITATNTDLGEYVLTAGGGGFRRKGL